MTKFCENCGASLTDTAKFCSACGHTLPQTPSAVQTEIDMPIVPTQQFCENCGESLVEDAKFCIFCGHLSSQTFPAVQISPVPPAKKKSLYMAFKNYMVCFIKHLRDKKLPMAKFCENCGSSLTDTAKFCNACGKELPQTPPVVQNESEMPIVPTQQFCENCGESLVEDAKFCIFCGRSSPQTFPTVQISPVPKKTEKPFYVCWWFWLIIFLSGSLVFSLICNVILYIEFV